MDSRSASVPQAGALGPSACKEHGPQDDKELKGSGYLRRPEPLRAVSFEEEELSLEELSFDELSFDELSFEPLSDLDFSSFLSFDEESREDESEDESRDAESLLPEDPGEEDFLA